VVVEEARLADRPANWNLNNGKNGQRSLARGQGVEGKKVKEVQAWPNSNVLANSNVSQMNPQMGAGEGRQKYRESQWHIAVACSLVSSIVVIVGIDARSSGGICGEQEA
jgi:hypothetical protein